MAAGAIRVEHRARLGGDEATAVRGLVTRATERDGVAPLSEHVLLHLRYGGDAPVRNLVAYDGDAVVGYAHLDVTDVVAGSSEELVVDPDHRRAGIGGLLVDELVAGSPDGRLRLWAHGEHAGAAELARRKGFTKARALWQMRRSLLAALPAVALPAGVRVRTFEPGRDEDAWLEVNNRAFAQHPEQGGWTRHDVEVREREPWFDPHGFFLAERADGSDHRLVGFHWTKVHGGADDAHDGAHGHEPMGEVYVVGVDPSEQGSGLGRTLTVIGLAHLRALGLTEAMLYVDESNTPAIHVYSALGFVHWATDTSYARQASGQPTTA